MHNRLIRALWGDLRGDELKKFLLLAAGMMLLIGSYWPLKILKDSVFMATVGVEHIPSAKLHSLLFFLPLIIGYSKLIDTFAREKMMYVLVSAYAIGGVVFAYFIAHPTIGVAHDVADPTRLLGWLFYLFIESYSSLLISLYWSYINDVTTPQSAKKGYGLITFAAQFGGLLSILVSAYMAQDASAYHITAPRTLIFSSVMLLGIIGVVYLLSKTVNKQEMSGYHREEIARKNEKVGFVAGIKMIISRPYVGGILGLILCSDLFDVIMSYQMNLMVKATYVTGGMINKFQFNYGLLIQIMACLIGLLGTSFFQRTFGIRACLMLYPVLLLGASGIFLLQPTLFVAAGLMILAKSLSYAFNQPTKEILYIPTSKTVRYKSKAWMDMFGKRFGKGSGSLINKALGRLPYGAGFVAVGLALTWGLLAASMGSAFSKVTKEDKIIS